MVIEQVRYILFTLFLFLLFVLVLILILILILGHFFAKLLEAFLATN